MAFTLNRRLSTLVNSSGQINTGKIPNDYISTDHIADNVVTTAMLHSGFTLPTSSLSSIDTDNVSEGSSNLYFTNARVDSRLSGGTGVTYSSGAISIGQAVATTDNVTFADLTVTGDLTITGDINSYNVTDLDVTDKTITIGKGQTESNSGGSGLIVDGASASILWDETNDQFDFNKGINVDSNTLVVDGTNNRVGILNASPDVSLDLGSATDGIHMPVGTTGQRPSSPAAGYFRYNSTDGQFEGYTTEWGAIAGSGGASAMETNNFTGDGSTTAFTLSSTVASEDNLIVFIEGIYQNKGDYVASGTTLTFTTAPVNSRRIVVQHILSSVAGNSTLYTSLTGNGSTTAFTLSGAPGHENNTQVFMDGVYQQKDSYIVNGTTLTFDAAPANNAEIEVMSFAQTTINAPGSNTVSVAELNLSDGSSGQFIKTDGNGTISFASVPAGYTDSNVETYLNTSTIYTDATNNRLGIGTANPTELLHVDGSGPKIKLGAYSFITEDIEDTDSLGLWTHTTESILFGQTSNNLTSQNVTCRIDSNGILRPTRFRLPASALPTSALSAGELHMDTGDSNKVKVYDGSAWITLNNASVGEASNPAADGAALLAQSASNGSYYFDHDGTAYQTYYIGDVLGGGWQLAMCVTNGSTAGTGHTGTGVADWFSGDTTVGAGNTGVSATGTNWFTASNSNELNVTSMTALNKTNSRGRGFFKSFTNMMIRQNIGGTVGYRSYVLNASNSLYSWFQTADHTGFTNRTSSSSTSGSGVTTNNATAIRLSNIDFNYQLNNDGGRIVTSGGVVSESSGGVACRVDGHRGYSWIGNVVNDYTARAYSVNGRLNDHTLWIFVK